MAISENDTTLCYLPLSHIFDRTSCALLAIYHGATIAYADKLETLLDDLRKYNPTWMNCVPRIYEKIYLRLKAILDQRPFRRRIVLWAMKIDREVFEYRKDANGCYNMHRDFKVRSKLGLLLRWKFRFARGVLIRIKLLFGSRLRYAFSGTAPIPAELVKFFHAVGVRVVEGYGLTESFGGCIVNPITACKPGYIGINACGGQSRISADGELEIKGAGVFKEYLKDSEWTEELFTDDGWFKTGDLADVDEHGYYRILDRKKSIICTDTGKNISPFKIVELFSSSDYIDQVLVIGDGRSYITALIVPKFNYFIDIFERESVRYKKDLIVWDDEGEFRTCVKVGDDFTLNFRLQDLIKGEVDKVNTELEVYEKIKQYTILTEKFTQQNGLLSSSQKVKKKEIIEKYLYVIDKMYM